MNDNLHIIPAPTDRDIREMVDTLVTPETADRAVKALIDLTALTADIEDVTKAEIGEIALRYAFTKTNAFETAFQGFCGTSAIRHSMADIVQLRKTM